VNSVPGSRRLLCYALAAEFAVTALASLSENAVEECDNQEVTGARFADFKSQACGLHAKLSNAVNCSRECAGAQSLF